MIESEQPDAKNKPDKSKVYRRTKKVDHTRCVQAVVQRDLEARERQLLIETLCKAIEGVLELDETAESWDEFIDNGFGDHVDGLVKRKLKHALRDAYTYRDPELSEKSLKYIAPFVM